jgi:short-subunit dehydrogenase
MNVVVTGASQGIGRAVAERFAGMGAHLFLCSRRMSRTLDWQRAIMEKHGCRITSHDADLSTQEGVEAFGRVVLEGCESVDVLVNNAGVFEPGNLLEEPEGQLERMLSVNLFSAHRLTRLLVPGMVRRRSGHIFNICSVAALKAYEHGGSYSVSKWALLGFTRNLREELKPHGVKVTAVHPGATMTASWDGSGIEPSRIMEARDVAEMVAASAMLSPQACVEEIVMRPQLGDL